MLKEVKLSENRDIRVHGRTTAQRDPATLLWTGSAIEMNVRCSELYIDIEGPYDEHENWIVIEINGCVMARQMVRPEREWVCVFRNKLPDKVTNVRIIKTVQAMNADPHHCLKIYGVRLDGEILPVPERDLKIEFIGDSINSGEGAIGAREEEEWISLFFAHERSYPYMVAHDLGADYRVISQSGWGLYASWDNQTSCAIPPHYEEICSVVPPEVFRPQGFYEKNDFRAWQPDVICINLGTNDDGAFHNAAHIDPATGEDSKLHMVGESVVDGVYQPGTDYVPEDLQKVRDTARAFLHTLRRCNPGAYLLWCYGILGDALAPTIQGAIRDYQEETNDTRVGYCALPNTTEKTVGARQHPGERAHRLAADAIVGRIHEIRGDKRAS